MTIDVEDKVAEPFREDVRRAVRILKEAGCTEVYAFGSTVDGRAAEESDLDLAVRGCPPGRFYDVLGKLLMELDHMVDLVSLRPENAFGRFLEEEGELVRIA